MNFKRCFLIAAIKEDVQINKASEDEFKLCAHVEPVKLKKERSRFD